MIDRNLESIINNADNLARNMKHSILTTEHIFLSLLHNNNGKNIILNLGGDIDGLKIQVEQYLHHFLDEPNKININDTNYKPMHTPALENIFGIMFSVSENAKKDIIDIYDLLVAITSDENAYSTMLLNAQNITRLDILENIISKNEDSPLYSYTRELVSLAKKGIIDPVIGRDDEINRVIEILCRRKKNNPLLVGEPGVGKTAIAEGIALKIAHHNIIDELRDSKIFALDMGLLIAGTKYRGDFEKRIKEILESIKKEKNAILFIDEIHTIINAGRTNGGSLDASNLLKPALANGELKCIGATTYGEFRNYINNDKALLRRFAKIDINEPNIDTSIKIIAKIAPIYEQFHQVNYTKEAIESCVLLSDRFINDRFLPDKAIDLLDEAGAYYKIYGKNNNKKISITRNNIEYLVSKNTKIPIQKNNNDIALLKKLNKSLKKRIFGQDEAIENLYKSLIKNKAGLGNPNKPIGVFLFSGPTGVGKSELAKELALQLHINFQRFDMSEYNEPHTISKLIGAPAGYVGFEQGGLLVESIRKHSHCVLLLDEIEKAHQSIYNLLLQVFDNATLTDNSGNKADFKNVIIIMTSNVGSSDLPALGFHNDINNNTNRALKDLFSPELRNRLDCVIQFNPLKRNHLYLVIEKQINDLNLQLKNHQLSLKPSAYDYLLDLNYDESLGAREIERIIEREIKIPLSELILFGKCNNKSTIIIEAKDNKLHFNTINNKRKTDDKKN